MKYSIECSVNGKVVIGEKIEIAKGTKNFVFIPNKQGWLSSIKIIAKVADPQKFHPRIEPGDGQVAMKVIIERDTELRQELIREFHYLRLTQN
jgi:predicted Ser/Thr protein kinase